MINEKQSSYGFSLAEMAVVLVIIGTIVGMSLSAGQVVLKVVDITSAKSNLVVIRDSLHLFREKKGRYPCPAVGSDVPSDSTYGRETSGCSSSCVAGLVCPAGTSTLIGVVPYKDLGLNEMVSFDSQNNQITYVVDSSHAALSEYNIGNISVYDKSSNEMLQSPGLGSAIFVLISHGTDGNGAWPKEGVTQNSCGAISLDIENCNNDEIFMHSTINESEVAAKHFDDFVLWYSQEDIERQTNATYLSASDYQFISGYKNGTCAVRGDNSLWCWGDNSSGQYGNNTFSTSTVHLAIGTDSWNQISLSDHQCGIKKNNTLWCWGDNGDGQLGKGAAGDEKVPVSVSGSGTWNYINVGESHSCGIKSDKTAWCWGLGTDGQLGNGASSSSNIPVIVSGGNTWKVIDAGYYHSCGIQSNNSLWCWGNGLYGKLGDNNAEANSTVPVQVSGVWKSIEAGENFSCGIQSDSTIWCWGRNNYGQLGDNSASGSESLIPVQIDDGGSVVWDSLRAGHFQACGIQSDGSLFCWGRNNYGQLGDGSSTNRDVPTAVLGGYTWYDLIVGGEHTCGIQTDKTILCWGRNNLYQFGDNTTTNSTTPTTSPTP